MPIALAKYCGERAFPYTKINWYTGKTTPTSRNAETTTLSATSAGTTEQITSVTLGVYLEETHTSKGNVVGIAVGVSVSGLLVLIVALTIIICR